MIWGENPLFSETSIPGFSRYVKFLPLVCFFGWKRTNFTHLEDPGILQRTFPACFIFQLCFSRGDSSEWKIHHPKPANLSHMKRYPSCSKSQAGRESDQKWRRTKTNRHVTSLCVCVNFWFLIGTLFFFFVLGSTLTSYFRIHQYKCRHDLKVVEKATGIQDDRENYPYASSQSFKYHPFWLQFLLQTYPLQFQYFQQKGCGSVS